MATAESLESATERVLGVVEILENIFLHLEYGDMIKAHRVSKHFKAVIDGSAMLKKMLFLTNCTSIENSLVIKLANMEQWPPRGSFSDWVMWTEIKLHPVLNNLYLCPERHPLHMVLINNGNSISGKYRRNILAGNTAYTKPYGSPFEKFPPVWKKMVATQPPANSLLISCSVQFLGGECRFYGFGQLKGDEQISLYQAMCAIRQIYEKITTSGCWCKESHVQEDVEVITSCELLVQGGFPSWYSRQDTTDPHVDDRVSVAIFV